MHKTFIGDENKTQKCAHTSLENDGRKIKGPIRMQYKCLVSVSLTSLFRAAPHECVFHALRCVPFRSVTIRLTYGTTRQPCGAIRQPHVSRAARCGSIRFVTFLMRRSASQRVWKELALFMGFYSYIF